MLKRRYLYASCASLTAISLFGLLFFTLWAEQPTINPIADDLIPLNSSFISASDRLGPADNLIGPPTSRFRDNIRIDRKYITSWVSAGWTNDVMTYMNLLYLALITERIPIIPMFTPSHIGGAVPPIDFGLVFDVPHLRQAIGKPVLEWHEVKDRNSDAVEELGCWNVWEASQSREDYPRRSHVPDHLKLDISYTKAPSWIKIIPNFEHDLYSSFWSLAALAFPETRAANLVPPRESPIHHVLLPPDEHVLCYDYLYFVCANQPLEFDFDYSPAWRFVGQHMRWNPHLKQVAEQYVRRTVGSPEDQPTPPWIGIHMRHGDFKTWCGEDLSECFPSFPAISRRVEEVKAEVLQLKGIVVEHVIMTSDETDPVWWDGVKAQGWFGLDHSNTTELYGPWYPVLIDAVIQSSGVGFVGTDRSTMSVLARRRVESWQDGAVRIVKWGKPDADDH